MHRWFFVAALALAGSQTACKGGEEPTDTDPDSDSDTSAPLTACNPALTLSPEQAWAEPYGGVRLTPDGGTGRYKVVIAEDGSVGAAVDPSTGSYVAGGTAETTDRVVVTDLGCIGEAEAFVDVVAPLTLAPKTLTVRPGTAVPLAVSGGSDEVSCAMVRSDSGGTVDADTCVYTAGRGSGTDRVRATDGRTGTTSDAVAVVDPAMRFRVHGDAIFFVPEGGIAVPRTEGGSGVIRLTGEGGVVIRDGAVIGEPGASGTLTVEDVYTGDVDSTRVEVVRQLLPELPRDGEASGEGVAIPLGDVNGDGYADTALGLTEASVGAYWGGMVAVYQGSSAGLDPTPVQVFAGDSPEGTFGRDIAAADVDGDGRIDLLIGADRDDAGLTNTGTVSIHRGVAGGFFEDEPSTVLKGDVGYGRLGSAVAACDFDGDGAIDREEYRLGKRRSKRPAVDMRDHSRTNRKWQEMITMS